MLPLIAEATSTPAQVSTLTTILTTIAAVLAPLAPLLYTVAKAWLKAKAEALQAATQLKGMVSAVEELALETGAFGPDKTRARPVTMNEVKAAIEKNMVQGGQEQAFHERVKQVTEPIKAAFAGVTSGLLEKPEEKKP